MSYNIPVLIPPPTSTSLNQSSHAPSCPLQPHHPASTCHLDRHTLKFRGHHLDLMSSVLLCFWLYSYNTLPHQCYAPRPLILLPHYFTFSSSSFPPSISFILCPFPYTLGSRVIRYPIVLYFLF